MLGWELPPHNSGGLGIACYQLCKALAKKGADIDFIIPFAAGYSADFMTITPATTIQFSQSLWQGTYDSRYYIAPDGSRVPLDIYGQQRAFEHAVATIVEEREFDVIHAHDWLTFRAALRAKEKRSCPLILHVHSIESDRAGGGYGNPLVREIEYDAMMLADKVIAVSNHTKQAIIRSYNVPESKIEVVHNSLDTEDFELLEGTNAYAYLEKMKVHGYKVVVNVGRLTIQKGLSNLLRAAREVLEREPKTFFLIVGSGDQYHDLLELSAELGIAENVIFTGFQRGKKWRDAYAIGDLFVMPSVSEPFGLTPLEAAGYGTPSLISKQSGVAEVLKNCLKVDYWDVQEMVNQICAVLQHSSLQEVLAKNAEDEFQRLSWQPAAESLMAMYASHIQGAVV